MTDTSCGVTHLFSLSPADALLALIWRNLVSFIIATIDAGKYQLTSPTSPPTEQIACS